MRILFTCSGTAGHINPALAIAQKIKSLRPDTEFLFVGSGRVMENNLIPAAGFQIKNVTMTGLSRSLSLSGLKHNIGTAVKMITSAHQARKIIREFKPDVVVGTGGYVCYPVIKAAKGRGIPTLIHESNAVPGLATKLLEGTVDRILVAFPDKDGVYRRKKKLIVTGTPIRSDFENMSRYDAKEKLGLVGKPLVVSFWGSLGAEIMNGYMEEFVRLAGGSGLFYHIHATGGGEATAKAFCQRVPESESEWTDVRPYINDMGLVMTAADLVLCRAGASTLAELTGLGRASILVPSPYVTNDHQMKNARRLEEVGAAALREEKSVSGRELFELSRAIVGDRLRLIKMERAASSMGVKDSAGKIAKIVFDMVEG